MDLDAGDGMHRVGQELRERHLGGAFPDLHDVLKDERDADGGDERRKAWGIAQTAIGQALDEHADDAAEQRRQQDDRDGDEPELPTMREA